MAAEEQSSQTETETPSNDESIQQSPGKNGEQADSQSTETDTTKGPPGKDVPLENISLAETSGGVEAIGEPLTPTGDCHGNSSGKELERIPSDCSLDVPSSAEELAERERLLGHGASNDRYALDKIDPLAMSSDAEDVPLTPVHFPTASEIKQALPEIQGTITETPTDEAESAADAEPMFNPFELTTQKSKIIRTTRINEELRSTSAVELNLSCRDVARRDLFGRNNLVLVVMVAGMVPGSWDELHRTETVPDTRSPEFVRKIRLPASTELDRNTEYALRVYNFVEGQDSGTETMEFIAETTVTISELVDAKQMTKEKALLSPRSGRRKGFVTICLDIILHEERSEETTFDFGFTECAPMRNRIFFVVSRALKKGAFSPVYRSEVQTRDHLSKFEDVTLTSQELHGGNGSRLFRLEVYRYYKNGSTTLLGFVQTSLEKMKSMEPGGLLYWWPSVLGFPSVRVRVVSSKVDEAQAKNWFVLRMSGE